MRELDLQAEALAMRRLWLSVAVLIAAAACAWPEAEQQAVGGGPALLALPSHPTDAGKPVIYDRQFIAKPEEEDGGCAPSLSCRLRLFGVIQITITVPSKLRATARFVARISSRASQPPASTLLRGERTPVAKLQHPVQRGDSNGHLGRLPPSLRECRASPITRL